MVLLNRLSWWLLGYLAATSALALLTVAGAALLLHWSVPLAQTWLLCAALVGYLLLHESHAAPVASAPPSPPPPEAPVALEDLAYLRRLWQQGDISEAVYRRAVDQATRRYVPPPTLPDPPRRRRRW